MKPGNKKLGPRLRIVLAPGVALGPGKADLLDGIASTGSIAAAGRQLGMSYKRAWSLVEALNADFGVSLVSTSKGGAGHGGAELTETGREVLRLYRQMEAEAGRAVAADVEAMQQLRSVSAAEP